MGEPVEALPDTSCDSNEDVLVFLHQLPRSAPDELPSQAFATTIASSIYAYEVEHDRSSKAYITGKYVLSKEEEENDRLDITYHAWRLMLNEKLSFAPLPEKPTQIIDIGTGSGIWALDVGLTYPDTKVIATDLSLVRPRFVPTNVEFEVRDCTDVPWAYSPSSADLIHTRIMNGFGICDWVEFYKESFKILKPGAYVESQEFDFIARSDDGSLAADSAILKWCTLFCEGALVGGELQLRLHPATLKIAMEQAGFVDVTVNEFKMPIGLWPADARLRSVGKFALGGVLHGFQRISVTILTSYMGWMLLDAEKLMERVKGEWMTRKIHSYWPCFVVYGKKPANAI